MWQEVTRSRLFLVQTLLVATGPCFSCVTNMATAAMCLSSNVLFAFLFGIHVVYLELLGFEQSERYCLSIAHWLGLYLTPAKAVYQPTHFTLCLFATQQQWCLSILCCSATAACCWCFAASLLGLPACLNTTS